MRQILRFAAAGLTACGLMALAAPAIAATDGAAGHCVTVTGNGSSAFLGQSPRRHCLLRGIVHQSRHAGWWLQRC
jgi:hypothetical protein